MPEHSPRYRFTDINRLLLHYLEWGNPTDPPIIMLHGLTGTARVWDFAAEALASDYHVLALDMRGHGESAWAPDGYGVKKYINDLDQFIWKLDVKKPALIGLSLGGMVSLNFTAANPGKARKLVLVDIGPEINPAGLDRIRKRSSDGPPSFASMEEAIALYRSTEPWEQDILMRHNLGHNLKQLADGRWAWRYDPEAIASSLAPRTGPAPDLWPMLTKVKTTTLLLRGEHSDILAPHIAERMAKTIPDCKLVTIPKAAHTVPYANPEAFLQAVRAFLSG